MAAVAEEARLTLSPDLVRAVAEENEPLIAGYGVARSYEEAAELILSQVPGARVDGDKIVVDVVLVDGQVIPVWLDPRPSGDKGFEVWAVPLK